MYYLFAMLSSGVSCLILRLLGIMLSYKELHLLNLKLLDYLSITVFYSVRQFAGHLFST